MQIVYLYSPSQNKTVYKCTVLEKSTGKKKSFSFLFPVDELLLYYLVKKSISFDDLSNEFLNRGIY